MHWKNVIESYFGKLNGRSLGFQLRGGLGVLWRQGLTMAAPWGIKFDWGKK